MFLQVRAMVQLWYLIAGAGVAIIGCGLSAVASILGRLVP